MTTNAELRDRIAIVTGGGNGIGAAIAEELSVRGAQVIAVDLAFPAQSATGDGAAIRLTGDVTDPQTIRQALAAASALPGRLSILVQSVFAGSPTPLVDLSDAAWDTLHDVLLGASRRCASVFAAALGGDAREGSIVNVASPHAFGAVPGFAAYASAKAGLLALTRAQAVEWGPRGIRSNAVAPGFIPVERNRHVWNDPETGSRLLRGSPLGRFGTGREVAQAAAFLAGPQASFVNGVCLAVDGGMTAMLPEALLR